jgi:hypothetical protein
MSYENQKNNDSHGAARSGRQREDMLKKLFQNMGFSYLRTKKECKVFGVPHEGTIKHNAKDDYDECGFSYFLSDGYCPELDAIIELKGGDKQGTTEEKLFFDLMKLQDKCYGEKTLFYIFEGKKEQDKCTKLFEKRLVRYQDMGIINKNVYVVPYSMLNKEYLIELAGGLQTSAKNDILLNYLV